MLPVVLSLLALGIGPLIGPVLQRFRGVAAALDGFIIVTVCGLVVLHVLPQSVALGGTGALLWAALGVAAPALLHRLDARQHSAAVRGSRTVVTTVVFVAAAFAHALLDGTALVGVGGADGHDHGHLNEGSSFSVLAVAVLLHRIPYGLALWLVGRERLGLPRTLLVLAALAAGTIAGAVVGDHLVTTTTAGGFALVQAFAAGAILHVLLDAPPVDVRGAPRFSFVGVVAGVGVLAVLAQSHPFLATVKDELDFAQTLTTMTLALSPGLIVGLLVASFFGRLPSRLSTARHGRFFRVVDVKGAASGAFAGALRGFCTCTVAPLYDSLVRRRASIAAATAFLVGAPELSSPSVFVTAGLVGVPFAAVRIVAALVLAIAVGVVVNAVASRGKNDGEVSSEVGAEVGAEVTAEVSIEVSGGSGFWRSFLSAFDHVAPWLVVGVLVAAFIEPLLAPDLLASVPRLLEVPLYAVVGVPFYFCGTGAAPVATVLLHKGASLGAVTALLLTAPATNLATLGLLSRLVSLRAAVAFAVAVFVVACGAGVVVNALVDAPVIGGAVLPLPSLHAPVGAPATLEVMAAVFVVALLCFSVARQGARGFLSQIVHPLDDAKGGHLHGPHCGHAEHKQPGFLKKAPVAAVKLDFTP